MRRSRKSLSFAFFALLAPLACADTLTVNTTTDDFQDNTLCSLREAVEFFNRGKPEGGFQGCEPPAADAGAVITVPADPAPYVIQGSAITVRTGLAINGAGRRDDEVTTLQVMGRHRAFVLNQNPQVKAPACGQASPATCATSPDVVSPPAVRTLPTFDLEPASDSAPAGDYLTTVGFPDVVGTLPGVSTVPLPAHSYVVHVYRVPETGEPVEIGRTKVPFSATPIDWQARVTLLVSGVHHLAYTTEVVQTATNEPVSPETLLAASPRLKVALYGEDPRITLRLSQMILNGGCQALLAADCANAVNDDTTLTNPPGSGYNEYALTFSNGLINTEGKGGIIYSNERLVLSDVLIRHGQANTMGGAVYLAADGGLIAEDTEFRENRAVRGAAIYAESNSIAVEASLFTLNDMVAVAAPGSVPVLAPTAAGAVLEVGSATVPDELDSTEIINSTLSGNGGRAMLLRNGAVVNLATIVLNTGGGIDFSGEGADVYNTILAGNTGAEDCASRPGSGAEMANNLVFPEAAGGCPGAGNRVIDNFPDSERQLMTGPLVDGKCVGLWGLLCPLADRGGATFVHMPRVLESYLDSPLGVGASPIINKGSLVLGGEAAQCRTTDQRGESRAALSCDIGAVELQAIASGTAPLSGGVISFGETYTQNIVDDLGDEVLLSVARCEQLFPPRFVGALRYPPTSLAPDISRVVADTYAVRNTASATDTLVTVPGCPWAETAPARGRLTFSGDGDYSYQPTVEFHGFDRFNIRAVTSLSALNALPADRSRMLKAQVIVEPATTMVSDKLGGALDLWSIMLLALAGLGWRRGGKA